MNNREFLFIYDAAMCNPNGDPDRENEPRMDKASETNLVSDGRLKRYIRDYFIDRGEPIFVSMVGGQKVSPETRLMGLIEEVENDESKFNALLEFDKTSDNGLKKILEKFIAESPTLKKTKPFDLFKKRNNNLSSSVTEKTAKKKDDTLLKKIKSEVNNATLISLIRKDFLDIRYFGGAFAIGDFSKTVTGSIQITTGYSLHPVKLYHQAIATIMSGTSEGQSNMGKKESVVYSLIAFTGTVNINRGEEVKLTDKDIEKFRSSLIPAIQFNSTTDSKKNQYPKFYLEIEYKKDEIYGHLGDLRNHISVIGNQKNVKGEVDYSLVRSINHLDINFSKLYEMINLIEDKVEKITIWKAIGFDSFNEEQLEIKGENKINIIKN